MPKVKAEKTDKRVEFVPEHVARDLVMTSEFTSYVMNELHRILKSGTPQEKKYAEKLLRGAAEREAVTRVRRQMMAVF